jgi:hypothetical protein
MAKKAAARKTTSRKTTSRKTTARKAAGRKTAGTRGSAQRGGRKRAVKRGTQKRETLTRAGKNIAYAKRRADGTFKEIDDVGRSLSADRRRKARRKTKPGYGDQGD